MTECSSGHLRSPEKWRLAAPSGGEGRELCAPVPNDAVSGPPLGMRSTGHMGGTRQLSCEHASSVCGDILTTVTLFRVFCQHIMQSFCRLLHIKNT